MHSLSPANSMGREQKWAGWSKNARGNDPQRDGATSGATLTLLEGLRKDQIQPPPPALPHYPRGPPGGSLPSLASTRFWRGLTARLWEAIKESNWWKKRGKKRKRNRRSSIFFFLVVTLFTLSSLEGNKTVFLFFFYFVYFFPYSRRKWLLEVMVFAGKKKKKKSVCECGECEGTRGWVVLG